MREQLDIIKDLHQALMQALDAGDVSGFVELIQRRESALEALQDAYTKADATARQDIQPELAALLPLDRDLQGRAARACDDLRTQLDKQRNLAPRGEQPVVSGVFDRQA